MGWLLNFFSKDGWDHKTKSGDFEELADKANKLHKQGKSAWVSPESKWYDEVWSPGAVGKDTLKNFKNKDGHRDFPSTPGYNPFPDQAGEQIVREIWDKVFGGK